MGSRYWITGVQIGMLIAHIGMLISREELNSTEDIKKILDTIQEEQFIGDKEDLEK